MSEPRLERQSVNRAEAPAKRHTAFDCDETALYPSRPVVHRGKGLYLWVEGDDVPYIDLIQGYSVTGFGHCDESLIEYAADALRTLDHVSGMTSPAREELANLLSELSPVEDGRVYFDVGGAHIVSLAIRLACRVTRRTRILALRNAFHGFSAEGEVLSEVFIGGDSVGLSYGPSMDRVEIGSADVFTLLQTGRYAAFLVESLQGANGLIELPHDWVQRAAMACRDSGTLFIADEVQVGMGRTGRFAAIERYGVRPDVVTYGKMLCAGAFPLSALVVSQAVYDRMPDYPASAIGSTFSTSPFGCALGVHVVQRIKKLLDTGRIRALGGLISQRLSQFVGPAGITSVRSYGLAIAIDLTDREAAGRFVEAALKHRIFIYACGSGKNIIKLYPPYTLTDDEAVEVCDRLAVVVKEIEATEV